MKRTPLALVIAIALLTACASNPQPPPGSKRRMASQVVSAAYNPSVSGLPGNVGDIVGVAGGATAWVKFGTGITDWQAFPGAASIDPATQSAAGSMSAADKAKLDAYPDAAALWRADVLRRAIAIDSTLDTIAWSSDFENISTDLILDAAFNGGTANLESVTNGGSILFGTSASEVTSVRVASARDATSATSPPVAYVSNTRTQHWCMYSRVQVVTAPSAAGHSLYMGSIEDVVNDNSTGIFGASANWGRTLGGAAAVDLGVAHDTSVHDLVMCANATDVRSYLDWVEIGSPSAASGLGTGAGYPRFYAINAGPASTIAFRVFRAAMIVNEPGQ